MKKSARKGSRELEAPPSPPKDHYALSLYVAGMTPRSMDAYACVKKLCDEFLRGRYELEVIDIYKNPRLAKEGQIIAAPTLVKRLPAPLRRLIGDLTSEDRVLVGLNIRAQQRASECE